MPGMRGIELLEHLAAAGRQMPTVLMSGRDDEDTKTLARSARFSNAPSPRRWLISKKAIVESKHNTYS